MLHDYPLLYVHVTCPYSEVRRRHKERGDRGKGRALTIDYIEQALMADIDALYDLTIDTSLQMIEECADKIIDFQKLEEKSTAFKTLMSLHTNKED